MTYREPFRWRRVSHKMTTAPAVDVVSTSEAKSFMRVSGSDDDTIILTMIKAATEWLENYTEKAFINQTWTQTMDCVRDSYHSSYITSSVLNVPYYYAFDDQNDFVDLARRPLSSITSIATIDEANNSSVYSASNYVADTASGRVIFNQGQSLREQALRGRSSIVITYVAGFGAAATAVPSVIKQAILVYTAQLYESRGACEPSMDVLRMIDKHKSRDYLANI